MRAGDEEFDCAGLQCVCRTIVDREPEPAELEQIDQHLERGEAEGAAVIEREAAAVADGGHFSRAQRLELAARSRPNRATGGRSGLADDVKLVCTMPADKQAFKTATGPTASAR